MSRFGPSECWDSRIHGDVSFYRNMSAFIQTRTEKRDGISDWPSADRLSGCWKSCDGNLEQSGFNQDSCCREGVNTLNWFRINGNNNRSVTGGRVSVPLALWPSADPGDHRLSEDLRRNWLDSGSDVDLVDPSSDWVLCLVSSCFSAGSESSKVVFIFINIFSHKLLVCRTLFLCKCTEITPTDGCL